MFAFAGYWKEGMPLREKEKDEEVQKMFQQFTRKEKIIPIKPYAINIGGWEFTAQPNNKLNKKEKEKEKGK